MFIAIALVAIFIFVNVIPYVIALGFIGFIVYKIYKAVKSWNINKSDQVTYINRDEVYSKEELEQTFNKNVIDVDFKEVK